MKNIHWTYNLTVKTLTPLHIGTGNTLLLNYDYVTHRGRTWVVNEDVLADSLLSEDESRFNRMVAGSSASDLIHADEYRQDSPLFRYVMAGQPRSRRRGAQLQELIKNAYDQPYIPGSSLKGAIRTAVAVVGWKQRGLKFEPRDLKSDPKIAGQPLEDKVLAGSKTDENHDLLRALQVSDTAGDADKNMVVLNVRAITPRKAGPPIEIEGVNAGVEFNGTITLDQFLLDQNRKALGWKKDQPRWLKNLPIAINAFSNHRVSKELERLQNTPGNVRGFYRRLAGLIGSAAGDECYLQLGWGGGWDSKTFNIILTDEPQFERIVNDRKYRMLRKGSYQPGDLFPKSRRWIVNENDVPHLPLGWVKLKLERVK